MATDIGQPDPDRSSSSALLGQVTDGSGWWPETEYRSTTRAIYPALLGTGQAPVNRVRPPEYCSRAKRWLWR